MNKKTTALFYTFLGLTTFFVVQIVYLSSGESMTASMKEKKILFVSLTALPDLALSSESTYIRHRSLSTVSDIYSLDGSLREYDLSTYTIANTRAPSLNHEQ